MFTVDRLNDLLRHYGGEEIAPTTLFDGLYGRKPTHQVLDELDRQAGLSTSGAYVGARLALHENVVRHAGAPPLKMIDVCAAAAPCVRNRRVAWHRLVD